MKKVKHLEESTNIIDKFAEGIYSQCTNLISEIICSLYEFPDSWTQKFEDQFVEYFPRMEPVFDKYWASQDISSEWGLQNTEHALWVLRDEDIFVISQFFQNALSEKGLYVASFLSNDAADARVQCALLAKYVLYSLNIFEYLPVETKNEINERTEKFANEKKKKC